jgi:hypothetical protein
MSVIVETWEYVVTEIPTLEPAAIAAMLNDWGEKGWELVAIRNAAYYFKRPKRTARSA